MVGHYMHVLRQKENPSLGISVVEVLLLAIVAILVIIAEYLFKLIRLLFFLGRLLIIILPFVIPIPLFLVFIHKCQVPGGDSGRLISILIFFALIFLTLFIYAPRYRESSEFVCKYAEVTYWGFSAILFLALFGGLLFGG
jgi:hypothetical protein